MILVYHVMKSLDPRRGFVRKLAAAVWTSKFGEDALSEAFERTNSITEVWWAAPSDALEVCLDGVPPMPISTRSTSVGDYLQPAAGIFYRVDKIGFSGPYTSEEVRFQLENRKDTFL